MDIRQKILSPFMIGQVELKNRLLMAPMAEITNAVTRRQMGKFGAAGCFSEMINVTGLKYDIKKNDRYLAIFEDEPPVGIQLYGKHLEDFEPAARFVSQKTKTNWLDLNFGCPAPKVTKNGGGSAMMKDPEIVRQAIEATIRGSSVPVTAKFRLGWDNETHTIKKCAEYAIKAGISAITLHPRTRAERFIGHSHWQEISKLKAQVHESQIPVIGSGDLWTPEDVVQMFEETNCDAIMLARGAFGNPWLFRQIIEYCQQGYYDEPSQQERIEVYLQHLREYIPFKNAGEKSAVCEMRKYAAKYLKGFNGASELRQKINTLDNLAEIKKLLAEF